MTRDLLVIGDDHAVTSRRIGRLEGAGWEVGRVRRLAQARRRLPDEGDDPLVVLADLDGAVRRARR